MSMPLVLFCTLKLPLKLLTLLIRIWASPIQVFIDTRSWPQSHHLRLVGHRVWITPRNRVYSKRFLHFLALIPSIAGLFCPRRTRCMSLPSKISRRLLNPVHQVFILGFPVQLLLVKIMFTQRKTGVKITDKRVRLTSEVLQGIRLIKLYAWEAFYTRQVGELRMREIKTIRKAAWVPLIFWEPTPFIDLRLKSGEICINSEYDFHTFTSIHPLHCEYLFFLNPLFSSKYSKDHLCTKWTRSQHCHHFQRSPIIQRTPKSSAILLFNWTPFIQIIRIPLLHYPLFLSSLSDALVAL